MKVLFLTHRLPYAPDRGDRIRAFYLLEHLQREMDVHLLSLVHDQEEADRAAEVATRVEALTVVRRARLRGAVRSVAALPTETPLTHTLLDGRELNAAMAAAMARKPDLVLAYCTGMARLPLARQYHGVPMVLDVVDVDSEKWRALGASSRGPIKWIYRREADRMRRFEAAAAERAAAALVVNERERNALMSIAPSARIHVVENGVSLDRFQPAESPTRTPDVVFCGVMNYTPNRDAALWLSTKVWPLVRRRRPDATLTLLGAEPPRELRALPGRDRSIRVTGTVPDVRPYLWRAAVGAAPLAVARGIQNKVLEALAAGLPVVVTPAVQAGLPPEALPGCRVAADAPGFAEQLLHLLALPASARSAAVSATQLSSLAWSERLRPLCGILRDAAQTSR